ncbi:MAG: 5-carboxymethyl-2-hydroxymuconate isomerase [Pseudomonadota bacterium]
MAHFIYEYSANLTPDELDLSGLMAKMHEQASASGIFPLKGLRSRAIRCDDFRVGDGNPDNAFINLSMKVGRGRDENTRLTVGRQLFEVLLSHFDELQRRRAIAISFEMRELEEHVKFNHNTL